MILIAQKMRLIWKTEKKPELKVFNNSEELHSKRE